MRLTKNLASIVEAKAKSEEKTRAITKMLADLKDRGSNSKQKLLLEAGEIIDSNAITNMLLGNGLLISESSQSRLYVSLTIAVSEDALIKYRYIIQTRDMSDNVLDTYSNPIMIGGYMYDKWDASVLSTFLNLRYVSDVEVATILYIALTDKSTEAIGFNDIMRLTVSSEKSATNIFGFPIGNGIRGTIIPEPSYNEGQELLVKRLKYIFNKILKLEKYRREATLVLEQARSPFYEEIVELPEKHFISVSREFDGSTVGVPLIVNTDVKYFSSENIVVDGLGVVVPDVPNEGDPFKTFLYKRFSSSLSQKVIDDVVADEESAATDASMGLLNSKLLPIADKYIANFLETGLDFLEQQGLAEMSKNLDMALLTASEKHFLAYVLGTGVADLMKSDAETRDFVDASLYVVKSFELNKNLLDNIIITSEFNFREHRRYDAIILDIINLDGYVYVVLKETVEEKPSIRVRNLSLTDIDSDVTTHNNCDRLHSINVDDSIHFLVIKELEDNSTTLFTQGNGEYSILPIYVYDLVGVRALDAVLVHIDYIGYSTIYNERYFLTVIDTDGEGTLVYGLGSMGAKNNTLTVNLIDSKGFVDIDGNQIFDENAEMIPVESRILVLENGMLLVTGMTRNLLNDDDEEVSVDTYLVQLDDIISYSYTTNPNIVCGDVPEELFYVPGDVGESYNRIKSGEPRIYIKDNIRYVISSNAFDYVMMDDGTVRHDQDSFDIWYSQPSDIANDEVYKVITVEGTDYYLLGNRDTLNPNCGRIYKRLGMEQGVKQDVINGLTGVNVNDVISDILDATSKDQPVEAPDNVFEKSYKKMMSNARDTVKESTYATDIMDRNITLDKCSINKGFMVKNVLDSHVEMLTVIFNRLTYMETKVTNLKAISTREYLITQFKATE